MNVSLTPELEKLVNDQVASGMYTSASEVIRAGLRLLAEQDQLRQLRFNNLKTELQASLDQERAGEVISGKEAFNRLHNKHKM